MPENIKCPNCGHQFQPDDVIREEVEKELRLKISDWQKKKNDEFEIKLQQEKKLLQQSLEEKLRKSIINDFENKLRLLEESNKESEEKLKIARQKELDFMKRELDLKNKEQELELSLQRRFAEEKEKLIEEIKKLESQKNQIKETEFQLRLKELEKQLEDQKKLAEEMRRKAEQGSMQLQGEVQELALEDMLKSAFPFDIVDIVGKGVRGADCIQVVRNNFGQECGRIVYESKRTNAFAIDWIEKIKADMRSLGADVAVIVTKTMPRDMDCFGIKDGVWICSFSEVKALAAVLRDGVIRVYNSAKNQLHKGDKMSLLYDYLTSNEFAQQWSGIREGFMNMKLSIQKERDTMEKLWKQREKQLEKVLLNAAHVRGSIEGIAGLDAVDLNLLADGEEEL